MPIRESITVFICVIFSFLANCQDEKWSKRSVTTHFNFASLEYRFSTEMNGIYAGYNYIFKERFTTRLEVGIGMKKPANLPQDYKSALFSGNPWNTMASFALSAGTMVNLLKSGKLRVNFQVGAGLLHIVRQDNWEKLSFDSSLSKTMSANYKYDKVTITSPCLVIAPRFEYAFIPYLGISVTPVAVFNTDNHFYGVQFGLVAGKVRRR